MTFGSKRFEVKSNPWSNLSQPGLSNLSDFFPEDDERLKWMYTQYGGANSAYFDPINKKFYPNFGQHEGSMSGGDSYDGFGVPIPRISPIDEGIFQTGGSSNAGCPSGFYQFGQTCVPDVSINPNSPGNALGGGVGQFFGKGDAKGLINAVVPPQFTAKNQEFVVLTDMQNVGGQPAKFYTRITIPLLNMVEDVSNSTLVMPLAKMKIGHRIIMPSTVTGNALLPARVELVRIPISNTGDTTSLTPLVDDQASVSIPSPGYQGAMPPPGGGLAGTIPSGVGMPLPGLGGVLPMQGYPGTFAPPPGTPGAPGSGWPGLPTGGGFPPIGFPASPVPIPVLPGGGGGIAVGVGFGPQITIDPMRSEYKDGDPIRVIGSGFAPGERVTVQIYDVDPNAGLTTFGKKRKEGTTTARADGTFSKSIDVPENYSGTRRMPYGVVAIGDMSQTRATIMIVGLDT